MSNQPARLSRRALLHAGSFGVAGLTLSSLLRAREVNAAESRPSADACILVFLWGSPSQYETFDPKPDAPDGIRGEFGVRQTRIPGVIFGEHVPYLAQRNDQFTLIRTATGWRIAAMAWTIEQPPACEPHPDGPPAAP